MPELNLKDRKIKTDKKAFVMGIVNATPDSFWSGSRGGIEIARRLIDEGADILDLGAESTRPGSRYIDAEEELDRLLPVLKEIRKISSIPVSIDTRKSSVMKACIDEGADILNDVSALEDDENMACLCASQKITVILMHKKSTPDVMQNNPVYDNVFLEVNSYLKQRIDFALRSGIPNDKIILDPGIGFGKSAEDNICLIKRCGELAEGKFPVLMALSRKSVIGFLTGKPVEERMAGTLAANIIAVERGASLIRVHDVKEAVDSLAVLRGINFECCR